MKYTFEPFKIDGSPRPYVGIWKPPFEDWVAENHPCALYYHMKGLRDSWVSGSGDKALYKDDE